MTAILATGHVPADLPVNCRLLFPPYVGPFLAAPLTFDPAQALLGLDTACLLLHGGADRQIVAMDEIQPLIDALARRNKPGEAFVVPAVSHNLKTVTGPTDPGFGGPIAPHRRQAGRAGCATCWALDRAPARVDHRGQERRKRMTVTVRPFTPAVGAEISGVDLRRLGDAEFAAIERAWHEHSVLLLRDQKLADDDLLAFSRRFGELDPPPNQERGRISPPGYPDIYVVSNVLDAQRRADRRARRRRGGLAHRHELSRHAARRLDALCARDSAERRQHLVLRHAGGVRRAAGRAAARARGRRIKHDGTYNSGGYLRKGVTPTDDPHKAPGAWHPAILKHPANGRADALSRPAPQFLCRGPVARRVRRAARRAVGARHRSRASSTSIAGARRPGAVGQPLDHAPPRSVRQRRRAASCTAPRSRAAHADRLRA